MEDYRSGLAFIELDTEDPWTLFKQWQKRAEDNGCSFFNVYGMSLATCSKDNKVGNRTVQQIEIINDSFIICTTAQGRKVQEMIDNPDVEVTFLWCYEKDGQNVLSQARIGGKAEQLDVETTQKYYEQEPFFCKIRAHVCVQGQETDWNELKKAHDELVKDVVENNKELPMPSHYRAFKIVPNRFDFYYAYDHYIADRIVFTKEESKWKHGRVGT